MRDTLRILVSGVGSIGSRHLRNLHTLGMTTLAFADPHCTVEKAKQLQEETDARGFTDFREALAVFKPEIVFICTPTSLHVKQAILAARVGCHLFIEKPLSNSLEDLATLERLIDDAHLTVMVASHMRFHPGPLTVYALYKEGRVGQAISARFKMGAYLPRWRPWQDYRESYSADPRQGGNIFDNIHEIDLALWLFGEAEFLNAAIVPAHFLGLQVDGLAEILLRHSCGTISSIHLNFVQRNQSRGIELIGTAGTLTWDIHAQTVEWYGEDGMRKESIPLTLGWKDNPAQVDEISHFLRAVEEGKQPTSTIADGKNALTIALAARSRGVVSILKNAVAVPLSAASMQ